MSDKPSATHSSPSPYKVDTDPIPLDTLAISPDGKGEHWYRIPSWRVHFDHDALREQDIRLHRAIGSHGVWTITEATTGLKIFNDLPHEFYIGDEGAMLAEFCAGKLLQLTPEKVRDAIAKGKETLSKHTPCPFAASESAATVTEAEIVEVDTAIGWTYAAKELRDRVRAILRERIKANPERLSSLEHSEVKPDGLEGRSGEVDREGSGSAASARGDAVGASGSECRPCPSGREADREGRVTEEGVSAPSSAASAARLTTSEINDALDLAECAVHDKLHDPNEREWAKRILQIIRADLTRTASSGALMVMVPRELPREVAAKMAEKIGFWAEPCAPEYEQGVIVSPGMNEADAKSICEDGIADQQEHWKALLAALEVAPSALPAARLASVWSVENKTSRLLFATEDQAKEYVASFPASVGGGMTWTELPVLGGVSAIGGKTDG